MWLIKKWKLIKHIKTDIFYSESLFYKLFDFLLFYHPCVSLVSKWIESCKPKRWKKSAPERWFNDWWVLKLPSLARRHVRFMFSCPTNLHENVFMKFNERIGVIIHNRSANRNRILMLLQKIHWKLSKTSIKRNQIWKLRCTESQSLFFFWGGGSQFS